MPDEGGRITGTKDPVPRTRTTTSSGSWSCLSNTLRLETYAGDAEREGDRELVDFFRRAQGESRKGAEQGNELLAKRLAS